MKCTGPWIAYALLALLNAAPAVELRISGDRMSARVEHAPIMAFLHALSAQGIRVRADPTLAGRVTLKVREADVDEVLGQVFRDYGYVLEWGVLDGPLGAVATLREVLVFRPGRQSEARALREGRPQWQAVRDPHSGLEYAAAEILLGFRPGSSWPEVEALLARIGGRLVESLPGSGVYRILLPPGTDVPELVRRLTEHPVVARIEPNWIYRADPPARLGDPGSIPARVLAPAKPGDAALAVLDTGLAPSGADPAIVGRFDALAPGHEMGDTSGHSTQMALIASGAVAPRGAGWDSELASPTLAVRIFDEGGLISNFTLMRAIEYSREQGARVVNMSWGSEAQSAFLETLIGQGADAGMVFVAAAGNQPTTRPTYPAAYATVLAVGALNADGTRWEQSNHGEFIALWAPGSAALPVGYGGEPGNYAGTSIASAYAARLIAEYFRNNPEANPARLGDRLRDLPSGQSPNGGVVLDSETAANLVR